MMACGSCGQFRYTMDSCAQQDAGMLLFIQKDPTCVNCDGLVGMDMQDS